MKNNYILAVMAIVISFIAIGLNYLTWQAKQDNQANHCATVNTQVITEFDALIAQGKFPTDAQQESWKRRTAGCQD